MARLTSTVFPATSTDLVHHEHGPLARPLDAIHRIHLDNLDFGLPVSSSPVTQIDREMFFRVWEEVLEELRDDLRT